MMKSRLFTVVLLWAILFGAGAYAQDKQVGIENNLIEAVSLYNDGDMQGARKMLVSLLSKAPENDAVNYYLGLCDFALRDFEEAESFLERAASLDPGNYWYQERLAVLYASTGQFQKATDKYESITEAFPKNSDPYYALLSLYAQQNMADKLSQTLQRISELSGDSPQLLTMQGDTKMTDYEDSTALSFYDKALEMDPGYAPAYLGKAEVMRMRRNYDDYFDCLDKYMFSENVPPEAKTEYLQTLFQSMDGRFYQNFKPQLDSLATGVTGMHPNDSTVLRCVGSYYYSTGRNDEAKVFLKRNHDLYPDSYPSTVLYVQYLSFSGQWEEAAEECGKAFEKFPYELGFLDSRVMAYYNMGDYDSAIRENARIIGMLPKKSPELAGAYATMGDLYHQKGDKQNCYAAYEKALKITPDMAIVLNNYAYYMCLEGKNLKKAYGMSRKAVELEPDNSSYLDTIGWILYLQGKPSDAKAYFKRAMIYGGKDSAECLSHYSQVLQALGESELSKYYRNLAEQKAAGIAE